MGETAQAPRCWCGGLVGAAIGTHYRRCDDCGAAVLAIRPGPAHFDVADDERDFYGKAYWTEYARTRHLPGIDERVRSDLSERCLFWLERLLEVTRPPGRFLEIGCGHGGFVRLARELGFDAAGTELSGWVADYARRTFDVPVLRGRIETLDLEPGFSCIAAFDVLEHLAEPLDTMRRCGDLLGPEGVLLLQTPWYRGEGPEWAMFQEDEHIHLFTEKSARLLLARAGFRDVLVRASLFPYDMWVVAARGPLYVREAGEVDPAEAWRLPAAFRALLGLAGTARELREDLAAAEADRAARLEQIGEINRLLQESEADRAARLKDVDTLTAALRESDADRAARLGQIGEISRLLQESEADRAARLEVIQNLQARLAVIEQSWPWQLHERFQSLTGRRREK